jgi:hypothetical protein
MVTKIIKTFSIGETNQSDHYNGSGMFWFVYSVHVVFSTVSDSA